MKTNLKRILEVVALMAMSQIALAQTLISGHGVAVTIDDIKVEIARAPAEHRAELFGAPDKIIELGSNLYVRRALAKEASDLGVDKVPEVSATLQLARDRILSDYRLEQLDKESQPSTEALEAYAQAQFNADPKRFSSPEQVRVKHILFRGEDSEIREQANVALKELKAGGDFELMAKERSKDPASAQKGGDIGMVPRGRTVKEFEEAAFALKKPGDISPVVRTEFGLHILKLVERKPAGIKPFEEVKETLVKEAQKTLQNNRRLAERERLIKEAKLDQSAIAAFAKEQSAAK